MYKRIISLILTLIMLITIVPVSYTHLVMGKSPKRIWISAAPAI